MQPVPPTSHCQVGLQHQPSWRKDLIQQVQVIVEKDSVKARELHRRILFCNWSSYELSKLAREGLDVSRVVVNPGLPGGMLEGSELAFKLAKGMIEIIIEGNKKQVLAEKESQLIPARAQLVDKAFVEGHHEGGRILSKGQRGCGGIGFKYFHLIATGKGSFISEDMRYEGEFLNNVFHDLTGDAKLFVKDTRYTGCFRDGKKCGHGKIERYDKEKDRFYLYFEGLFEGDQPHTGTAYGASGAVLVRYRDGALERALPEQTLLKQALLHSAVPETVPQVFASMYRPAFFASERVSSEHRPWGMNTPLQETKKIHALQEMTRPQIAFGKAQWEEYFGDVGVEPPLPENINEILKAPCAYWPEKKVEDTHLLVLIPKTVGGKLLTLNSLGELIERPRGGGHSTKYRAYWDKAKAEFGESGVSSSYWTLMSKDVIPDSRNKKFADQCKLVKSADRVPKVLEALTAVLMHHVMSGERLYSDSPETYTRCEEKCTGWQLAIGGFGSGGLGVSCYIFVSVPVSGVAVSRKF